MRHLLGLAALLYTSASIAAYSNYNSVLIGQEAAGFGGAYTALYGDSSAVPFYNPAAMTRMDGATVSATVNAFQKLDTTFGDESQFADAPTRINQGFFEPVPSAAGTVIAFGHFALGLSIILPDFNTFTGEIESSNTITSFLNQKDQSLWVGGSFALNLSQKTAVGLTAYYTARSFLRSVTDQIKNGTGDVQVTTEDKSFTQNSLLYIFGVFHQFNKNWSTGLSVRLPSIPISGAGSYFRSDVDTNPATPADALVEVSETELESETEIPWKISYGLAYKEERKFTISFDASIYGPKTYDDLNVETAADRIVHDTTWNLALGGEYYFKSWISGRLGVFTNNSSHPDIISVGAQRIGDHIDMWGISSNFTFHSSEHTQFTFGGYWTGGSGTSVQRVGQNLKSVDKNLQIFSMIVGSSYSF